MTQLIGVRNAAPASVEERRESLYAAVTASDMAAFHALIADHFADLNDIYLACERADLDPAAVFETYTQWLNETAASVRATAVSSAVPDQPSGARSDTERCDSDAESATYAEALERAESTVEANKCSNSLTFNLADGLPQGSGATAQPRSRESL